MKFTTGIVLAAIAVAGVSAESSKTQTVDPSTLTHVDPSTIVGLGPAVPAGNNPKIKKAMEELAGSTDGTSNYLTIDPKSLHTLNPANIAGLGPALRPGMPGYGQNAQFNKAWAEYLAKDGKPSTSGSSNTVDPKSLPIQNPADLQGLGPQTQGRSLKASDAKTTTFNPSSQQTIDPAQLEGLGPQTPAGDNPKIKQGMDELTKSGSTNTLDTTVTAPPTLNPATYAGLGPAVLPGMPGYGQNAQFNKAWAEYLAKEGKPSTGSSNYYTVDPKSLPIQNPADLQGLGPQTQGRSLKASDATTTTFNPSSQQTIDPAQLEGLGPQTPAGDNPKMKKAMKELAGSTDGTSNYLTIDPKSLHTLNPANIAGLGPALRPGMPGYGKNEKANKAWKEFLAKEGASTSSSGSAVSNCAQVCPEVYKPVCGSDGVTYSNSCFLGLASCKSPEKHITKASDDACSKTTQH